MASSWWRFVRGASSSSPANFLHFSRTNIQRICELVSGVDKAYREPLNPHQCRSMSSKLERTMTSVERLVDSVENQHYNLICGSAALENFYRVSEKAKQLIEDCCSTNWCQASAFQIQNEEAFKEILLETSLCHNTIHKLAEDLNRKRTFENEVLRWSFECEPPSADDVFKDRIALLDRLKDHINDSNMLSSDMRSLYLAKYLLGRMHCVLERSIDEDFDVRSFSLWSDGKGPDGEWSKESEFLGGNVCKTTWLDIPCAKKLFKDEQFEQQWFAEAKLLASLNHPNIVKFLCCNKYETPHSSGHFIAMEQMEMCLGFFIKRLKKEGASLSLLPALDIILQIACGLCYLHERGVAHRDLKTSNVVVRGISAPHLQYLLQVKVADFGLSKVKLNASKSNTISHPKTGTTVYMPPEAFSNGRANWFKADVYSFSVMCSVILTGEEPFQNIKRTYLFGAICRGERPSLPKDIPKELASVIVEGWATERDLRPDFFEIRTRLEKLRHQLLRENTLGSNLKQEEPDYSHLYIEEVLKNRVHDCLCVRPQTPTNSIGEEESFDGDEAEHAQACNSCDITIRVPT